MHWLWYVGLALVCLWVVVVFAGPAFVTVGEPPETLRPWRYGSAAAAVVVFAVRFALTRQIQPNDLDPGLRKRRGKHLAMSQAVFERMFLPEALRAAPRAGNDRSLSVSGDLSDSPSRRPGRKRR